MKFLRYLTWNANICVAWTPLAEAFATFEVTHPVDVEVRGFIVLKHRGNMPSDHYKEFGDKDENGVYVNGSGSLGWGFRGALRGPFTTQAGTAVTVGVNAAGSINPPPSWIKGAKVADNMMSLERHYAVVPIMWDAQLTECGWYRFEMWGAMHGSRYAKGSAGYPNPYPLPNDFSALEINAEGGAADPYNSISIKIE